MSITYSRADHEDYYDANSAKFGIFNQYGGCVFSRKPAPIFPGIKLDLKFPKFDNFALPQAGLIK